MKSIVYCTIALEGFHDWPGAPEDVSFLRVTHRHIFNIIAYKEVHHNDRDVEFILLKREITDRLNLAYGSPMVLGSTSCEQLALRLILECDLVACNVSEDNENGAILYADTFLLPA